MAEKKDKTYEMIVGGSLLLMVGFMLAMNSWREENEANVAGDFDENSNPASAFENIKNLNNDLTGMLEATE